MDGERAERSCYREFVVAMHLGEYLEPDWAKLTPPNIDWGHFKKAAGGIVGTDESQKGLKCSDDRGACPKWSCERPDGVSICIHRWDGGYAFLRRSCERGTRFSDRGSVAPPGTDPAG